MTQRIRGITDAEATGPAKDLFEASNRMLGRTANLQRILAHSLCVARWLLPFIAAVRQPKAGAVSDSFRTELDPEEHNRRQPGAVGVSPAALDDYTCRICSGSRPAA